MHRLTSWNEKVVVITGASSGIGRLLALRTATEGAQVALVARNVERLTEVEHEILAKGGKAFHVACDVAEREAVIRAAEFVLERCGRIDVLINNAGYGRHLHFAEWDLDDMERMVRVNLLGSVYWTKAVLPHLIARQSGWIVFVASVAGKIAVPDESVYAATKFGMLGLAESLSMELEEHGIHVLTICPGAVDTEFFTPEMLERLPAAAKRLMIPPERVVQAAMNALASGRRSVTVPGAIAASYAIQLFFPGFFRRMVRRVTRRFDSGR